MPKSSTTRLRQRQLEQRLEDGVGSVDEAQAEAVLDTKLSNGSNSSVLDKLSSMDKNEREWACSSLTYLVREETAEVVKALEETDGLKAVVECLCDTEPLVVCAALGLVHACTVSGNQEVQLSLANKLVQKDAIAPLLALCGQHVLAAEDAPELKSFKTQLLSRLFSVLCNLASLNDIVLQTLCSPQHARNVLAFAFTPLQHRELHSQAIMIYAAQLLSILTDLDDESETQHHLIAFRSLFSADHLILLKATMANNHNPILLRALLVNVLMNLTLSPDNEGEALATIKLCGPVLSLTLDNFDAAAQLLELDTLRATTDNGNKDQVKHLDNSTQLWKDALDAQGLILELFANLLVLTDEDNYGEEDFQEMQEAEEANALMQLFAGKPLFPAITKFLVESDLASRLLRKCIFVTRPSPNPQDAPLADDPEYLSLQLRALGCLQNVVLNPEFAQTTLAGASAVWREVCDHICAPGVTRTTGDLETVHDIVQYGLGVLNQVLRVAGSASETLSVAANDFQGFITIANSQNFSDAVRSTALAILGLLTGGPYIPALDPAEGSQLATQVLGLFTDAMAGSSLILAVEGANALMDGFAEPTYNTISSQSLIPCVNKLIAVIKSNLSSGRRTMDKSLLDRLDETRVNLGRFIKYKQSQ